MELKITKTFSFVRWESHLLLYLIAPSARGFLKILHVLGSHRREAMQSSKPQFKQHPLENMRSDSTLDAEQLGSRGRTSSVDFLHGALTSSLGRCILLSLILLLAGLGLLVNVQAKGHQLVDALSEASGLINGETRDKKRGLEE
jgi:hypothetical protein